MEPKGESQRPVVVQSLIGKQNLPFYLQCLRTLLDMCRDPIRLALHEDGTLDEEDRETVATVLGETYITPREEGEARTLEALAPYPEASRLREESIWGMEFFDPLFAEAEPFSFYVDADILFLRPFGGLFGSELLEGRCIFLRDIVWHAYSILPSHLRGPQPRPRVAKGITTAVVCWDKRLIDWEYVEWFLSQPQFRSIPEWTLPTLQAGLALSANGHAVDPRQIVNAYPRAQVTGEAFGVHLLGSYRKQWLSVAEEEARRATDGTDADPATCRFLPCEPCGALELGLNQLKRRINNRIGLLW